VNADDSDFGTRSLHLPLGPQIQLERRARSWSQRELAHLLGVSSKSVERWEGGRNRPHPWAVRRLRELFAEHPVTPPPPTESDEPVDKREFAEHVLIAGLVPAGFQPWDRLLHALTRPAVLDTRVVDEAEAVTAEFHKADTQLPARQLFESILRHVDELASLLQRGQGSRVRQRITVTAGESAALAGWMAWEMGAKIHAERLYGAAAAASQEANEQPLMACVLGYRSCWAAGEGRIRQAVELLQAARERAARAHPAIQAWLAGREAEERARLGPDVEVDRLLELARNSFATSGQLLTEHPWIAFLDEARVESFVLSASLRLGQMASAAAAARRVLSLLPAKETKRMCWIFADLAEVEMRRGDQDAALHHAREAIGVVERTESRQGFDRLARLGSQIRQWGNPVGLRPLHEELQRVLPTGS
jgi:transcriptional regulator with XRE-family HTH domain